MKLEYHKLLSNFAFNVNLRRYVTVGASFAYGVKSRKTYPKEFDSSYIEYQVGRCRLTL